MTPLFEDYTSKEMYEEAGVKWCVPMTAKEIETEEEQSRVLSDGDYYVEEKFDGTRATLHFFDSYTRCFSRRVSEKTGWFCENSDSLPHLRDLKFPNLAGTIIDGEMFIPDRPFKDVSSTLNCKWDKAIQRQEVLGKIVFHAFDILYYKGVCIEGLPLCRRKQFLQAVLNEVNSPYIEMVKYYSCDTLVPIRVTDVPSIRRQADRYPTLIKEINALDYGTNPFVNPVGVSPKAYYEFIVATGGEGVIVKPKNGKYHYKRGREYQKIKKFLTREVIIMGFNPPTDDYKGKFPTIDKWDYWETSDGVIVDLSECDFSDREYFEENWYPHSCRPVSKFYAKGWIGTIRFGVVINHAEINKLPKNKKFNIQEVNIDGLITSVIEVGECSGFDEHDRKIFSDGDWIGSVIEVKANELFKDTGKLRHPRFLRVRYDKSAFDCTWEDHISL